MHLFAFGILAMIGSMNVSVPFTYFDNRMVIECRIDGKGPFHMIVDTGDPDVTITPQTAAKLTANVRGAGKITGAGNLAVQAGRTRLKTLSIGTRLFGNVEVDVIDLTQIRTKFHFPHLDGIIGYPILSQFATFVDVNTGRLALNKTLPVIPPNATKTGFQGVLPVIHATINGIPSSVLVDTGDRSSLTLFGPFAKQHSFYGRFPSTKNVITGYGLGGPIYADVFRLPDLIVLGAHLSNVVTRASRQKGGAFASSQLSASIGTGVLKRFNVVYDYSHRIIVAWPSKYYRSRDAFVPPPG